MFIRLYMYKKSMFNKQTLPNTTTLLSTRNSIIFNRYIFSKRKKLVNNCQTVNSQVVNPMPSFNSFYFVFPITFGEFTNTYINPILVV